MNIEAFQKFYASNLGLFLENTFTNYFRHYTLKSSATVMGVGYPMPILNNIASSARVAFLPDAVGETIKPGYTIVPFNKRQTVSALPKQFDLAFILHSLEYASNPRHFLQNIWKMLKPEGRLIVILPLQNSGWHKQLSVPANVFYKPRNLKQLFEDSYLTLIKRQDFLFPSPTLVHQSSFAGTLLERFIKLFSLPFGGNMTFLEAQKNVFPQSLQKQKLSSDFSWDLANANIS